MDPFVAWNLRLLQSFFSPASSGEEVWLALDPEELDAIAPDLGGDRGLVDAVRKGPPWPTLPHGIANGGRGTHSAFSERAVGLADQRRLVHPRPPGYVDPGSIAPEYVGRNAPSYLPFLACLIRCAATQDESGFYAEIRRCVGLREGWHSNEMAKFEALWSDLALWSAAGGAPFGRFEFRQLGAHRYVGVPRSQSIILHRDSQLLTRVFAQCAIRPGQPVTEHLLSVVHAAASEAHFLSAPFRDALGDPDFKSPVRARLRSLLEDWDGTVFRLSSGGRGPVTVGGGDGPDSRGEVELALELGPGNALPWRVSWRVPALRDVGLVTLREGNHQWRARLAGTERVVASAVEQGDSKANPAAALLARSEHANVRFSVFVAEDGSAQSGAHGELVLQARILRTLVAEREPDGRVLLVERPLPSHGGGYLLAATGNVGRLRHFLAVNNVRHQPCPADGLPEGWALESVPDCQQLSDEVLDELPTGEATRPRSRLVRLVGGRAVQRGGIRQYLAYDLPGVELDAPAGTTVKAAGLTLVPE